MADAEVRSVLVPITGDELLLPNASIAEIVAFVTPTPIDQAPDWLLGNILWRGWQVPVMAFATLIGADTVENTQSAKVCVTKSLTNNQRMPYVGVLAQGFPRLVTVTESALTEVEQAEGHIAVAGRVIIGDRQATLPDLDRLAQLIAHAAFGTLPTAI